MKPVITGIFWFLMLSYAFGASDRVLAAILYKDASSIGLFFVASLYFVATAFLYPNLRN